MSIRIGNKIIAGTPEVPEIDDSNFVHKTGSEYIDGEKTFIGGILKVVNESQPRILLFPKVGTNAADSWGRIVADSSGITLKNDRNEVGLKINNSPETITLSNVNLPANSNDSSVPSTSWVNSRIVDVMNNNKASFADTYVTLNTQQDITGIKTAVNCARISKTNFSEKQSSNIAMNITSIKDSNNNILGEEYIQKNADGSVKRFIRALQNTGDYKGNTCGIEIRANEDGTACMYYNVKNASDINIPDTGIAIPTMTKVNSRITDIMDSKVISESGNNYIKFGNGLLIQWGNVNNNGGVATFTKPFKYAPYIVLGLQKQEETDSYTAQVTTKSTTSFKSVAGGSAYYRSSDYVAIGQSS